MAMLVADSNSKQITQMLSLTLSLGSWPLGARTRRWVLWLVIALAIGSARGGEIQGDSLLPIRDMSGARGRGRSWMAETSQPEALHAGLEGRTAG